MTFGYITVHGKSLSPVQEARSVRQGDELYRTKGLQIIMRLPDNENSSRRVRWRTAKTREATKTIRRQHQTVDTITTSQCVRAAEDRSRWKQLVSQAIVAEDHTWSAEKKKKGCHNRPSHDVYVAGTVFFEHCVRNKAHALITNCLRWMSWRNAQVSCRQAKLIKRQPTLMASRLFYSEWRPYWYIPLLENKPP